MTTDTNYFNINAITQNININKSDNNIVTVELPYPYMRVDPRPTNDNPNNYQFKTLVRGKTATITKINDNSQGWAYDIKMNAYYNKVKINVGPSEENSKTVELPHYNMLVDPRPINKQEDTWEDKFDTKVNGKALTVTRIDDKTKVWMQDLELYAYFDHEPIVNVYPYLESVSNKLKELFNSIMGKTYLLNYIHNDNDVKKYIDKVNSNVQLSRDLTNRLSETEYMSEVHSEKLKIIKKHQDDIDLLIDEINELNNIIKESEEKIKKYNANDDKQIIINQTNEINKRIINLRVKENNLLQNIRNSSHQNRMNMNELNEIQDMSTRNNKSYKGVSLRYIQDENKKNMKNIVNILDESVNELKKQSNTVYNELSTTDRLKNSKKHLQKFSDLKQQLNEISQVSENFSNYSSYKEGMDNNKYENEEYNINYTKADYKDILLTPEECEKIPNFNENIDCNENNYKANNIKCMSKVLCDNNKLSMKLNSNQTNSSQDKSQYNDVNKIYNVHFIHSINLIVGIICIGYIISKK